MLKSKILLCPKMTSVGNFLQMIFPHNLNFTGSYLENHYSDFHKISKMRFFSSKQNNQSISKSTNLSKISCFSLVYFMITSWRPHHQE